MNAYPACQKCGCNLARHSLDVGMTTCRPCGGGHYDTHLDFIDNEGHRGDTPGRGNTPGGICQRGHDLDVHGVIVNKGGGKYSRKCGACRGLAVTRRLEKKRAMTIARRAIAVAPPTGQIGFAL